MTTIFTVSVDSVEGSAFCGRVHVVNPDVPYVPAETVFALSLLVDAWWKLEHGSLRNESREDGQRYPFTEEQGKDITAGMRRRDEFPHLFDLILGKEIRVTEDGYLLSDDGKTVLEPRRKAEDVYRLSGGSRPGYSVFTHGDAEEFSQRADDIVTSFDISPYRNAPHLNGAATPEDLDVWDGLELKEGYSLADIPYAEIVVTVGDPGYLEHLVAGMRWETTMTGEVC
ncbi:hypothetical protein AB0I28_26895 [Phytomonospora sp. NPDC050363]|uniref:hypothetical protein n=1 Tax=Phytomonospora sp. NPDC050363 TaxID=3155642 RepID=UPI0033C1419D